MNLKYRIRVRHGNFEIWDTVKLCCIVWLGCSQPTEQRREAIEQVAIEHAERSGWGVVEGLSVYLNGDQDVTITTIDITEYTSRGYLSRYE